MDVQRKIIQNSSYYINHYNNNNYPINTFTNIKNINIHNSYSNQNNLGKPLSLKNTFIVDNRVAKANHQNHQNYNYNNINNKLNNSNNNNSINSFNDISSETKSNNSIHSNSSTNTIKSMLNTINKNIENSEDISFQKIKSKKYPLHISFNSSNQEANYTSKNLSTNISYNNDINRNKYSLVTNSTNQLLNNQLSNDIIKKKIENAKINEEILLPSYELNLESLTITKPIKIKGQQNSCLIINEGPILIDLEYFNNNITNGDKISDNNNNYIIKFSQLKIVYNDNKINKEKKITALFKLQPNTFLELEDCDICLQNKKNVSTKNLGILEEKKSVAFLLSSNKKNENKNNYSLLNPTILTLTNTRIHNFYQSIRAGQNCIVNINKSAFIQNYGKAIVMINPISLKVNETFFQYNLDNTIHIKYMDDCLYEEKRKIFINKNEFDKIGGNNICIEGIKNKELDLSIIITKNNFHNNSKDGVLIYNLIYYYFEISNNIFKKNQGNGLNIQKSFFNGIFLNKDILYQSIKIKDNQFIENKGFGLFINDCIIEIISNKFILNRQSGMSLCNIMIENPQSDFGEMNLGKKSNEDEYSMIIKKTKKISTFLKNTFYENGESGLFIHGYPYYINISENVFNNNYRHGIAIDLGILYNISSNNKYGNNILNSYNRIHKQNNYFNFYKVLNEFKSCTIKKSYDLANIRLNKCVIEKNMKSGISINYCLVYCEETFIINNIEYAILTKKKEFKNCFKDGKKNVIDGQLGGEWGQIDLNEGDLCGFSCFGGIKYDNKKKEEIIKKVPSFFEINEDKSLEEDHSGKRVNYSYNNNIYNNNINNQNQNIKINKSSTLINNNKVKKEEEDNDCFIY